MAAQSSNDCDSLWSGADLVTMRDGAWNIIRDGFIAVTAGRIVAIGPERESACFNPAHRHRFAGGIVTPGFIDCHTHLVFGGDRSAEFEQRLNGVSYADIAAQGGGILSTVRATREASLETLVELARERLALLMADGVTTVEIKSGYGLDKPTELRMLRAARCLGEQMPVEVVTTCLAAHAVPPEYRDHPDGWIKVVCDELLPEAHAAGLADAVDAFCEHLAFSPAQVAQVFEAARKLELPVKLHAEQLSALGGAGLAARYQALSADHLEYATDEDIRAMAEHGTVAVLLPGAFYLMRETQHPPVVGFRQHKVPMALASDLNPGTSPALSLRLMLNMGCTLFGLTPEEAVAGVTLNAARALGLQASHGSLEPGKVADFVHWNITEPAGLVYWLGGTLPCEVVYRGERR
jgi:imidazolonepropionase